MIRKVNLLVYFPLSGTSEEKRATLLYQTTCNTSNIPLTDIIGNSVRSFWSCICIHPKWMAPMTGTITIITMLFLKNPIVLSRLKQRLKLKSEFIVIRVNDSFCLQIPMVVKGGQLILTTSRFFYLYSNVIVFRIPQLFQVFCAKIHVQSRVPARIIPQSDVRSVPEQWVNRNPKSKMTIWWRRKICDSSSGSLLDGQLTKNCEQMCLIRLLQLLSNILLAKSRSHSDGGQIK